LRIKKNEVILNLYHDEINRFLKLSETSPDLAGHFAVAMCLTDNNTILPLLTPEAREDLIQIDAITRFSKDEDQDSFELDLDPDLDEGIHTKKFQDFKRRLFASGQNKNY